MIYTYKSSFVLLLSHFLVTISTPNIDKVVSMLFVQRRWTYVDSTFLYNQMSTLKRHWIDVILSMLFRRCFVNVFCLTKNSVDFTSQISSNREREREISVSKMEKFGLVIYTAPYSLYCKTVSVYLLYFSQ